jgi:DNA-binding response OmpR family regulator
VDRRVEEEVRAMAVIVVADDDAEIADFIRYSFEVAGHTVHTALDGVAALRLVRAHRPDLVVLDESMPGLTGLQVAAELRARDDTADVPVVMISGSVPGDVTGLVDRLVAKPLRPRELAAVMRELFGAAENQPRSTRGAGVP